MGIEDLDFTDLRIATVIPILFILIRLAINTFGMLPVENLFLTNFKRLTIFLGHSLALTIVILFFLIFTKPAENPPDEEYSLFLMYMITSILIAMLAIGLVRLLSYIFSIKISYYIAGNSDNDKWFIGRVVGNGKILLYNEVKRYKFVNSDWLDDKVIDRSYDENHKNKLTTFMEKHEVIIYIFVIAVIFATSGYTLWGIDADSEIGVKLLILLLIEYLVMIYVYTSYWNIRVMKEIDKANPTSNTHDTA